MSTSRVIVLKFGGSVLKVQNDVHRIAQEIYRWRRSGYQVVAVVSAIGNTTDELSSQASEFGTSVDDQKIASLLATGELRSAALLGLALDRAGVSSCVCDESAIGLKTCGQILDARLVDVNVPELERKLEQNGVVILPGFIGRNEGGELTLLGRGGSDLTALFVAARLGSVRCRLVKDVDGLYEFDPQSESEDSPRRYQSITFADALKLDESIVQHKAVRFAEKHEMSFEVATVSSGYCTRVGSADSSSLAEETWDDRNAGTTPLRVALLGLGTVGLGVYRQINELFENEFDVVAVAVSNPKKAIANGVPADRVFDNALTAVESSCDVVIELVGGDQLPQHWITTALEQRKHVITANKSLLARELGWLVKLATDNGVTISCSASVGGSVPVLETVRHIADTDQVVEIVGVLNGSTNFVLEEVTAGTGFDNAVEKASELGLTERNPYRDLGGVDAAEKMVLIARECGVEIPFDDIQRQELTADLVAGLDIGSGSVVRQIGQLTLSGGKATGCVVVKSLKADSIFSRVTGAGNLLEVVTGSGKRRVVHGLGAGRWPTTAAVIADLLDLSTRLQHQPSLPGVSPSSVISPSPLAQPS